MQNSDRVIAFQDLGDADLYVGAVYLGGTKKTIADEPLAKLLPVGNQGGFRPAGSVKEGRVHFAVLFTSGKEREWPDRLDPETGVLTYFGDNRKPAAVSTTRRGTGTSSSGPASPQLVAMPAIGRPCRRSCCSRRSGPGATSGLRGW